MRNTIAMDDQTLTYLLGYLTPEQWACAMREDQVTKARALELLDAQDAAYGGGIRAGVGELLAMSKEDFKEHMAFYNKHHGEK